ncbi:MAG TPA: ABC transporter permease subunit [Phycisphaerae bacterium]|nr:ABC transporter permease subunit [Phycisphaerae bacterium]
MPTILKDLSLWFWRLVPANPILVRVVHAGGRRKRHLWIRLGYLSIMAVAVVIGIALMQGGGSTGSLADFAKQATIVFKNVSLIQLGMVCVLAPVFAAAAITQEKDSQTYNILLSTPLTNGQIVLGSLLSRLFFVIALLIASIPLFCIIMVYGGVTGDKIMLAIAIATATALLMGSIAISISVIKIGTGRTIFSFYLAIAVYLMTVYVLGSWSGLIPPEAAPSPTGQARMSWLAAFHPFLAMFVILGETPAPNFADVAHYGFPGKYLLAYPHYSYIVITTITSLILLVVSFAFVRRSAKEGEPTFLSRVFGGKAMGAGSSVNEISDDEATATAADARRKPPRTVSKNPIAWRESVTSAAAGGGKLSRILLLGFGALIAIGLFIAYLSGSVVRADLRQWLVGVVLVEFGITLFVATTAAATSMTREKESNTLELILATPLTSTNVITGKTWGLIWAAGPMLLIPYFTVLLFVVSDLFRGRLFDASLAVINPEALITLPVIFLAFTAFACMIGLKSSIKSKRTMGAVFTSAGVIAVVIAGTWTCVSAVKSSGDAFTLTSAFMPLTPVTACYIAIDPVNALTDGVSASQPPLAQCRVIAMIATFCSALIYFFIGWYLRNDMVRSYDMTIRKQMA